MRVFKTALGVLALMLGRLGGFREGRIDAGQRHR